MTYHKNILFKLPKITLSALFLLSLGTVSLQSNDKKKELSFEVYPQWYSNEDYTVQGNIGVEKEFNNHEWVEYYVKPSATYALDNNWALHGGLGGYYKDDNATNDNRWEVRPYIGVSHYTAWTDKWKVSSYLRVEERYFDYIGDEDNTHLTRLRFRVRAAYTLDSDFVFASWHRLTTDVEVFKSANTDRNTTDEDASHDYETRLILGLERYLENHEKLRFELGWKYKSKPGKASSSSVNTVYFRLKYYPVWGLPLGNKLFGRDVEE
jgi:hypothetical protein